LRLGLRLRNMKLQRLNPYPLYPLTIILVILAVLLIAPGEKDLFFSAVNKGFKTKELQLEEVEAKAKALFKKALNEKDLKKKEKLYLELLKLWPSYAPAYNNLADTYERMGRYKEAIKNYEIAKDLAPHAPYPYFGLGDVYFKLGNYKLAITYYEKGLKIEPNDKASLERLKLSRILTTKILFPFDSYRLTEEAKEQLKIIAEALSSPELKNCVFEIQGHTDSIGPAGYNLRLSLRRAETVKKFLIERCQINKNRLTVKGYGEDRPIATNGTKEGRERNRRVEVSKLTRTKKGI